MKFVGNKTDRENRLIINKEQLLGGNFSGNLSKSERKKNYRN